MTGPLLRPDLPAAIAAARGAEYAVRRDLPPLPVPGPVEGRPAPRALRLCYLMPRTDVGGGARVQFEHANRLAARGHDVTVLSHFAAPNWFDLRARFRRVPFGIELAEAVPECDVIVAGYWDQIRAARSLGIAPVVHFEQGDFHLFDAVDPVTFDIVGRDLAAADATVTVAGTVAEVLRERYGVAATVVHNAVDPRVFTPSGPVPASDRPYVLFVGWDGNEFKGMAEMRRVWSAVSAAVDLVWVTPHPPQEPLGKVVVAPSQPDLAAIYRGAAAYVCCSRYESFSLPCLEAMASGTPVVATRNTGVLEYARDGENALLADVRDADGLTAQLRRVLDEPGLAERLREGGLATAARYSWDVAVGRLEDSYRAARGVWPGPVLGDDWQFDLSGLHFAEPGAAQRLRRRAAATTAGAIAVPVAFPVFEGHRAVRWRVVGRRFGGGPDVQRAYLPASSDTPPRDLPYPQALRDFGSGRVEAALAGFVAAYRGDPEGQVRAAAGRWIVLTLLELGRDAEAADVVAGAVEAFPDHSDYHYLRAMTALLTGGRVDAEAYVTTLELLGPATRYDEWFDDPVTLIRERLPAVFAAP
ncbi:glycosyltransferase [Dactylosporangium sp. NPDC051485]|uniref:glycosyltransferase n=1 Tax=Dactylosporangium sp. NPDC051485 TaxID=3154846 RepID=UPI0034418A34